MVAAAEVTKGAFYHHFASKQEIFLAVYEQVQREIGREAFVVHLENEPTDHGPVVRDLSSESNAQVWNHLLVGCRAYLELHMRPDVQRIVLFDGRAVLPWSDWHRVQSDHGVTLLRADLRRAMNRGLIRNLPLVHLATLLAGALQEACILIAHSEEPEAELDEAMRVVERFLQGLLSSGAGL
jgi:AcrR family transcriptional regulator